MMLCGYDDCEHTCYACGKKFWQEYWKESICPKCRQIREEQLREAKKYYRVSLGLNAED
jgi:Zn finger protein HypA/HybF involved in hydrogenase expression